MHFLLFNWLESRFSDFHSEIDAWVWFGLVWFMCCCLFFFSASFKSHKHTRNSSTLILFARFICFVTFLVYMKIAINWSLKKDASHQHRHRHSLTIVRHTDWLWEWAANSVQLNSRSQLHASSTWCAVGRLTGLLMCLDFWVAADKERSSQHGQLY